MGACRLLSMQFKLKRTIPLYVIAVSSYLKVDLAHNIAEDLTERLISYICLCSPTSLFVIS